MHVSSCGRRCGAVEVPNVHPICTSLRDLACLWPLSHSAVFSIHCFIQSFGALLVPVQVCSLCWGGITSITLSSGSSWLQKTCRKHECLFWTTVVSAVEHGESMLSLQKTLLPGDRTQLIQFSLPGSSILTCNTWLGGRSDDASFADFLTAWLSRFTSVTMYTKYIRLLTRAWQLLIAGYEVCFTWFFCMFFTFVTWWSQLVLFPLWS